MYKRAEKYLSDRHIKPSFQRMAIMNYLMTHRTHPTAEAIYSDLSTAIPVLSRKTVYNTVALLAEKGAVLALDLGDGSVHYDGDTTHHAHFICTRCGVIRDLEPDQELIEAYTAAPPPGVRFTSVQLTYKGLCEKCNVFVKQGVQNQTGLVLPLRENDR